MVDFKLVIADPKSGKCYQKELKDPDSKKLFGHKIGDTIKGELVNLAGYEFEITGGSDYCGFPMRRDVLGVARKRILSTRGIGVKNVEGGDRKRKTVAGNAIYDQTSQVNLKTLKVGKEPLAPVEEAVKTDAAKKE